MTAPTREEVARGLLHSANESNKELPEGGHRAVAVAFQSFGAMADYVLGLIREERDANVGAKPYSVDELEAIRTALPIREKQAGYADAVYENSRWLATVDALRTRVEALTRDRDAATKALVELHRRSEAFGAFVRGEYGITSEDEEDHNVSEFFAAVDMSKEAISALLAIGDAGGGV